MSSDQKGRFALQGLDRVMHERARLGILSCLAAVQSELTFGDLKDLCSLTDGNLSRHLHALEEEGIIRTRKEAGRGRALTWIGFTTPGRERFLDYVDLLESVLHDSQRALRRGASSTIRASEGVLPDIAGAS